MSAPRHHTEPLPEPPFAPALDPAAEAGCAAFESTLLLMDGLLEGESLAKAAAHVAACETCGPLVEGWPALHETLVARFEDAAERAKPDFVELTDAVLERIGPPQQAAEPPGPAGWLWQTLRRFQPHLAFAAAAVAIALAVLPLAKTDTPTPAEGKTLAANDAPPTSTEPPDRPVVVLRDIRFDNDADGMVYRTPRGGMTILWVTENDGA